MTTKLTENMNLDCAVKLLRYDDLSTSNNETVVSVADNESIAEVKRSVRISRKRTKPIVENGNQSDNVKNKKCMIKKPKLNKTDPGKTDTLQKEPKKSKIQDSSSVKSTENYLINDDLNVTSVSTPFPNNFIDNEDTVSVQSSFKPPKFKISKSIIAIKNKPIVYDVNNDDPSNKIVKADNIVVPLKSPKTKTPKYTNSNRKKLMLSNVSKNNTSCELEENNSNVSTKTPKNKTPKSINTNKKKSLTSIINNVDTQDKLEINDNFAVPVLQAPKNKTSKSIVSNRKKAVVNNINKTGITDEHETSNKIELPRKRGRTSLKKEKCQKLDFDNICNNEDKLEQTQNSGIISTSFSDVELQLSQNFDDNTMMLRSNHKPPKIKKKWSDEWSENKLSKNVSKSNNEEFSRESSLKFNSSKMLKKIPKPQKSKNSNCKKVKTTQQFNPNHPFVSFTPIPVYDNTDKSSTNVPLVQNDCISITYHIPLEESIPAVCNDTVSEPVDVCNTPSYGNSSSVSVIHTTSTENLFSNNNIQQSHLSTLEPILDSNYLSASTISTENTEMSYGMAILSEAISRQSRELANKHIKKKSPEPDIITVQSCPEEANSTSQSQVPSAMKSPQRVTKNMSKKILKYSSELCSQSVEKKLELHVEHEINLLSKRFNIPSKYLRKAVIEEPLSVFQKKYSKSVTPSMVEISPIDVNAKSGLNVNYVSGNIDVEYKLEPIRESAAYEKNNLKDLMIELSKTMPSWSLSIVPNPQRYVISHMSISMYGVPTANKCIVLDRMFRASVYINQSLEHKLCKSCTTPTEIINLIKELNSI